jgi:hypothetical protein
VQVAPNNFVLPCCWICLPALRLQYFDGFILTTSRMLWNPTRSVPAAHHGSSGSTCAALVRARLNPFPTAVLDQGPAPKPFSSAFAAHSKPSAGTIQGFGVDYPPQAPSGPSRLGGIDHSCMLHTAPVYCSASTGGA